MRGGSGNAGGGGYSLQARMIALVEVHILSGEPLVWVEMKDCQDIPFAISAETGGPGDDFRVELLQTNITFEVQAKRGLNAGTRLDDTLDKFVVGLESDPSVHCILAIDPTSGRSIRTHLLDDLGRLRQGRKDGLHKITQEVLQRITAKGSHPAHELAQRISLHVFDIEHRPANDRFYALHILRRILADPDKAEAAWSVLVDDALQLIQSRGRRDEHSLAGLLRSNRILLANTTTSTSFQRYLHWLEETTETFLVPGLGVRLSIKQAWVHLKVFDDTGEMARTSTLEAKIAAYHEWERLSYREHLYPAQDVTEFGHRVVVIGGPGAGKSTLCQRTAHRLARSGEHVLRVRLPLVAQRCFAHGESIDQAILSVAADGSGIPPERLAGVFNEPDCLLADGLDECGRFLVSMAEQLRIWALARPRTRVVVTTRPIGYDPAFFEDWIHVDLLPLDVDHIEDYARSIFVQIEHNPVMLEQKFRQFQSQIKNNRIASMAARSPLLLVFLVQLTQYQIPFAQHRAALYEQMLTLWYRMPPKDRAAPISDPGVIYAHEVLNRVGWHLLQPSLQPGARSRQEIIDALAPQLCENGQSLVAMKERVENGLTFWQERGVLELLQVGSEEAYTFIYATIGEYAAGRHIATWNDQKIKVFVERAKQEARWREPLLFAAGMGKANVIAEQLLSLDRENDPLATESLFAAAVLAETAHPSPALALGVAQHITNRLCSPIPAVAYESAQNGVGLATQLAEEMESLLHPLFSHPQLWTRLTALRLALAAGDAVIDIDALEVCFDKWPGPPGIPEAGASAPPETDQELRKHILGRREPWSTWNEVLRLGAEALVRRRPGEATAQRLGRLAHKDSGVSMVTSTILLQQLKQVGYADIAAQIEEEYTAPWNTIDGDSIRNEYRQPDQALLEAVLRVTGSVPTAKRIQRRPIALSMLVHALRLPQSSWEDWLVLRERQDLAALDAVLTGVIVALDLDRSEIAADASWALARVTDTSQTSITDTILLSILPKVPVKPNWKRAAKDAQLSTPDLVYALRHPSGAIAASAARLLAAGVGGPEVPRLLEDVLEQGDDFALELVALLASFIWREDALAKLLHRLDGPLSRGCRWLLRALPRISKRQADEAVREVLIRGLTTDDPYVAVAAAETLQSLPDALLKPNLTNLQIALTEWSTRGDYCEHHQCYIHSSCCNFIPLCPRAEILKLLARLCALTLSELLDACHDPHGNVRSFAAQGVARVLATHPERISEVVDGVDKGKHPSSVLEAILALPTTTLMTAQEALIKLFSSESAVLRRIMVRNVATATWLTKEQAINITQVALDDSDLTVRNLAVTTLRSLKSTS